MWQYHFHAPVIYVEREILFKITSKLLGKVKFRFTLKRYNKPVWNSIILGMKSLYEIYWSRKMREREAIKLYDSITNGLKSGDHLQCSPHADKRLNPEKQNTETWELQIYRSYINNL